MTSTSRPRLERALDLLALAQFGAGLAGLVCFSGMVFWSFTL
jgi:hypothetical protein